MDDKARRNAPWGGKPYDSFDITWNSLKYQRAGRDPGSRDSGVRNSFQPEPELVAAVQEFVKQRSQNVAAFGSRDYLTLWRAEENRRCLPRFV